MDEVPSVQAEVHEEGDVFGEVEDVGGHLQDWKDGGQASAGAKDTIFGTVNYLMAKVGSNGK